MILSRISHAIRTQNWFAVVLEFVIVIAGVVIGFQVTEWRSEQADRHLETYYVERLHADLVGTLDDYFRLMEWDETQLEAQDVALDALRTCSLDGVDRATFVRGVVLAGNINPVPLRWGTVNELEATGNIALIRDLGLRERLARVDGQTVRYSAITEGLRQDISLHRPLISSLVDVTEYGYSVDTNFDARFDFDELCTTQSFTGALSVIRLRSDILVTFNHGQMEHIAELESYLASTLGVDPSERPDGEEAAP